MTLAAKEVDSEATEAVSRAIIMDSSNQWLSSEMTETLETTRSRASLSLTKDSTRVKTKPQNKSSALSHARKEEEEVREEEAEGSVGACN